VSDYAVTTRIAPWFTFGADRSLRLVYRNLRAAKRYWLVMVSGFFEPLFYLVGLGIGVGALVGEISYGGQSIAYEEFVAPALLAASAMNGAIYETTGNVFFKLNYAKTYDGVLATPLGVRDVAVGETIFALMRGAVYSVTFVGVMLVLGLIESPWALLAVPAALLIGAAFAAIGLSAVTLMRSWADFAFIELLTLPMFLFSATFVPLEQYPEPVQWLLPVTPLYHGVDLLRALTLGNVGWDALLHVAYLLGVLALGVWFTARRLERKLLK
jgi:lipooligosaccharide transport system permease protein